MSEDVSTERIFSLSCFEGLQLIKRYGDEYPSHSEEELIQLIEHVESDGASLDLVASFQLGRLLDDDCAPSGSAFYQSCIKAILIKHQPIWSKMMRQGRRRFIRSLDAGDQDVFAAAKLLEEPPSAEVVSWWDEVSGHSRLIFDRQKMDQGREAELLTIAHEKERLGELGIERSPEWPGLDDNFAGYDVLSYDQGPSGITNKMIEVKSTTASPLRFFITRNEWKQAEKVGDSYWFHVWDMNQSDPILHVRSVDEIAPHVPSNNGKGAWSVAEIPVGI